MSTSSRLFLVSFFLLGINLLWNYPFLTLDPDANTVLSSFTLTLLADCVADLVVGFTIDFVTDLVAGVAMDLMADFIADVIGFLPFCFLSQPFKSLMVYLELMTFQI